ncbi:MAG: hypothetical protein O3A46_16160 [Candidatus Poribacteria bacterium]|nr:hypothetical protein [Candidatus Poribacteria bacterium]
MKFKQALIAALLLAGISSVAWSISAASSSAGCPLDGTPDCPLVQSCCK